jgi:poly(A) polymerase
MDTRLMWTRIEKPFLIPAEVRQVLHSLIDAGFEAYLVGGCVRDSLKNLPIKDYDVATSARPEEVLKIFPRVVEVGRAFGVMKVITEVVAPIPLLIGAHPIREIEVATFRTESDYQDRRRPNKVKFSSVEEDAARRDFTINALYYDIKTAQVLDLFNGLQDLQNKIVRAIANPKTSSVKERFEEDALRLLRAVRFAARFHFTIEPRTAEAIRECAPLIKEVSVERVREELLRMLELPAAKMAILDLDHLHLLEPVLPEVAVGRIDQKKVWDQTLRVLAHLPLYSNRTEETPDAFFWTALFLPTLRLYPIEKRDAESRLISTRLKLSNECADQMAYLARETPKFRDAFSMRESTLLRWMHEQDFPLLMRFHELDAVSYDGNLAGLEFVRSIYPEAQRRFNMKPLLTGDDLVNIGMRPGRHFTEILRVVEDLVLEGTITTQEQALEYVLKKYVN